MGFTPAEAEKLWSAEPPAMRNESDIDDQLITCPWCNGQITIEDMAGWPVVRCVDCGASLCRGTFTEIAKFWNGGHWRVLA